MKKLITYDLNRLGKNYPELYEALHQIGARQSGLESVWLANTAHSCVEIRDYLIKKIDSNDQLFVARFDDWAAFGLPQSSVSLLQAS